MSFLADTLTETTPDTTTVIQRPTRRFSHVGTNTLDIAILPKTHGAKDRGYRIIVNNSTLDEVPQLMALGNLCESLFRSGFGIDLDLRRVEQISSVCIGVVMNTSLVAGQHGTSFQVIATNDVREKLELCSLGSVANLRDI